ncbi:DUF1003 domain-containing protein [Ectobacillus polymachus]|uniref:DUF1003 domain-containing protein n=1 Tax=Ectobacillus polymachus TaxID=1508806 RepID=UPI003A8374C9
MKPFINVKTEKPEIKEASQIQGFDINLNDENLGRIDRLVDHYEQNILRQVDKEYNIKTTRSDRLADNIAKFGGSWTFIIVFGVFLIFWMIWNSLPFTKGLHFDEQPFILLNLCLSFLAAFQAPIIMMSQNRQAKRDKHESVVDFAINYKAEEEIDDMQHHLHRIESEVAQIKELLLELRTQEK